MSKQKKLLVACIIIIILAVVAAMSYLDDQDKNPGWEESDKAKLVDCLNDDGATLYVTTWCPYCKSQISQFGSSAKKLNIIKCDNADDQNYTHPACILYKINGYPTWIFNDNALSRLEGSQRLNTLADYARCPKP